MLVTGERGQRLLRWHGHYKGRARRPRKLSLSRQAFLISVFLYVGASVFVRSGSWCVWSRKDCCLVIHALLRAEENVAHLQRMYEDALIKAPLILIAFLKVRSRNRVRIYRLERDRFDHAQYGAEGYAGGQFLVHHGALPPQLLNCSRFKFQVIFKI